MYFKNEGREQMQGRRQAWTMGGNGPLNFLLKKINIDIGINFRNFIL